MHTINVTGRGKGSGDAWGLSVRDQLGGRPDAKRLDLMSREEKRENQAYWKARTGYSQRWVVEGVFSMFKRMFGEHVTALKWENILQEIRLKVALYNRWRDESIDRPHVARDATACALVPELALGLISASGLNTGAGRGRNADGVTDIPTPS